MQLIRFFFRCDDEELKQHITLLNEIFQTILHNIYDCDRFANQIFSISTTERPISTLIKILILLLQSPNMNNSIYLNQSTAVAAAERNLFYHLIFVCATQCK